jgi:putative hydrolases of HD superfamily
MRRLDQQIRFASEAGLLKGVLRQTMLTRPARRENSAEHSWHLAVLALALAEHAPPGTDIGRVVAMLLLHDLVEIDAGDLFLYADEAQQARQQAAERAAAERIYALLPADQAVSLRGLWEEFEQRVTPEARFARALDRLQPMLENSRAGGGTWREHGITADQVTARVTGLIDDGSPALGRYAREVIRQAVADGILAPAQPAQAQPAQAQPAQAHPARSRSEEDQLDRRDHPDEHHDDPHDQRREPPPEAGSEQSSGG